jgi:integrase/recombinase XerC/integrase/recombinase XerD
MTGVQRMLKVTVNGNCTIDGELQKGSEEGGTTYLSPVSLEIPVSTVICIKTLLPTAENGVIMAPERMVLKMVLSGEEVPVVDAVAGEVDTNQMVIFEPVRPMCEGDLLAAFAQFLKIDLANGDARADTVRTYKVHFQQWVNWCLLQGLTPSTATESDVKAYRQSLLEDGKKHSTISLKLTIIRRFYDAAKKKGYIDTNPAEDVKPPKDRAAGQDSMRYLRAGELELLIRALPTQKGVKALRDRAMVALMALEGLRVVEVHRANITDIEEVSGGVARILVHGKGKDAFIYPSDNTLRVLREYLSCLGEVPADEIGVPLFTAVGNRAGGKRITRDGVRNVIEFYLKKADLKRPGFSCHVLRHTCGALLYQTTKDVKVVQETLRHSDMSMAAKYSHIINRSEARYTNLIPVSI